MKIKFFSIIFSILYKKKKKDMLKEVEILEEWEKKSILTTEQSKRLYFLLKRLRELEGIPEFDTEKEWKKFEKDYLPIVEKWMEENKKVEKEQ